jgi:hypothetical protein
MVDVCEDSSCHEKERFNYAADWSLNCQTWVKFYLPSNIYAPLPPSCLAFVYTLC